MSKKIVVISGSPRRDGNSSRLVGAFIRAAEAKGLQIERFDVASMKILGCFACDSCFRDGKPCAVSDDFNKIAAAVESADGIVFASPLYWYSFSAQFKAVFDKFYSFCRVGKNFAGKKTALFATCEEDSLSAFDGMKVAFDKSIEYLRLEKVGEVFVCGVGGIGAIEKTDGEARAAALVEKFL